MTTFFIAPVEPDKWDEKHIDLQIDPEIFEERLREKWPMLKSGIPGETTNMLLWYQLPPEEDGNALTGGLQANRQVVSLETGPRQSFVEFVLGIATLFLPDFGCSCLTIVRKARWN